jgi:hypothetical protein
MIHGKDRQMVDSNCALFSAREMDHESTRVVSGGLDDLNDLPFPERVQFNRSERVTVQWAPEGPLRLSTRQFASTFATAQHMSFSGLGGNGVTRVSDPVDRFALEVLLERSVILSTELTRCSKGKE